MKKWITVKDAAKIRKCSERNIIELIKKGEFEAKKDGKKWIIFMEVSDEVSEKNPQNSEIISVLKLQLEEKDLQIRSLQQQMEKMRNDTSEAGQRHDTIILQMTRQLEQSQRMLEYNQSPWYRKWFRKREKTEK